MERESRHVAVENVVEERLLDDEAVQARLHEAFVALQAILGGTWQPATLHD